MKYSQYFSSFYIVPAVLLALLISMGTVSLVSASQAELRGHVVSGDTPLASLSVTLYGAGQDTCAATLGVASTNAQGAFAISYKVPRDDDTVFYLIATSGSAMYEKNQTEGKWPTIGRGAVGLASVLGTAPVPTDVVINERTTVASAYALAQFIDGPKIAGKAPGLQNAAAMLRNLVDVTTGEAGSVLMSSPNGAETQTWPEFNSLANLLATCVNDNAACLSLFSLATPPGGQAPGNTLQAVENIAHYPALNVNQLFNQSQTITLYQPAISTAPVTWTLALRFVGDGVSMSGPGNVAFDKGGNAWVLNNYVYNADPTVPVCSSDLLLRFKPNGEYFPGSPYTGGGVSGAGFGITLDPDGNLWLGNFGFAGNGCTDPPPHNSVSKFSPDGMALSPDTGFTEGSISGAQGTVSDKKGNIWIASCGNSNVTQYPRGEPDDAKIFGPNATGLSKPFDIAIDPNGWAYVTGNASNNVAVLRPDGSSPPWSPITTGGFNKPMGIAVDSHGNFWVANSGLIDVPCPNGTQPTGGPSGQSITLITPDHKTKNFTGGGITIPWGIAVDGNDNVWVANFGQQRLSQFCGVGSPNCAHAGDAISPDATGYGFDGLVRNTGVNIDPSGNVWLTNNWETIPLQTDPGGHQMAVFIGLAAPVKAPTIGPPQKP